jgi:hypothetical protein
MVNHCQYVTGGGVDMRLILDSFHEGCHMGNYSFSSDVWDNTTRFNLKVFGRYAKLYPGEGFSYHKIYTQDDDCILNPASIAQLIAEYEPGTVTCNLPAHRRPEYTDGVALVGWGAIFDRTLTSVFNLYLKHFPLDDLFLTECDRVFTGLNRVKLIDVPFTHLPHATDHSRMCNRPDHWSRLAEIRRRIHIVKKREGIEVTI